MSSSWFILFGFSLLQRGRFWRERRGKWWTTECREWWRIRCRFLEFERAGSRTAEGKPVIYVIRPRKVFFSGSPPRYEFRKMVPFGDLFFSVAVSDLSTVWCHVQTEVLFLPSFLPTNLHGIWRHVMIPFRVSVSAGSLSRVRIVGTVRFSDWLSSGALRVGTLFTSLKSYVVDPGVSHLIRGTSTSRLST